MSEFSEPNNDHPFYRDEIQEKIRLGHFWDKDGAIADVKELACLSLSSGDIPNAVLLMINIHTTASEYALNRAVKIDKILDNRSKKGLAWLCRKQYRESRRALWRYNTLWRFLSFFRWI